MHFSVWPNYTQSWDDVFAVTRYAEETGWHGVWFADHFMPNEGDVSGPVLECFSVLAGLAAATSRIRLGSLVAGNTYRHPAVLANQATVIDHISGGRFVLGVGAGWQENEHDAYGIELPPVPERLARLEEACAVFKGLLTQERTDFDGRYYRLTGAPLEPKPVQDPMPLLIGAKGEKVALRIVARYADEWNAWGTPDVMAAKGRVLDSYCEAIGRDPATIRRSTQAFFEVSDDEERMNRRRARIEAAGRPTVIGTAAQVQAAVAAYAEAGVDEVIIPDWALGIGERRVEALERLRTEVFAAGL